MIENTEGNFIIVIQELNQRRCLISPAFRQYVDLSLMLWFGPANFLELEVVTWHATTDCIVSLALCVAGILWMVITIVWSQLLFFVGSSRRDLFMTKDNAKTASICIEFTILILLDLVYPYIDGVFYFLIEQCSHNRHWLGLVWLLELLTVCVGWVRLIFKGCSMLFSACAAATWLGTSHFIKYFSLLI